MRSPRRAFTLIELIATLSIIGLLISLLLPAVQRAREAARSMQCKNNLRQIGLAIQTYHSQYNCFPHEINKPSPTTGARELWGPYEVCSALVRILPGLDQVNVYSSINFSVEFYPDPNGFPNPVNRTAYNTTLSVFLCPTDRAEIGTQHGTNYMGNFGVGPSISTSSESPESANGFFTYPDTLSGGSFPDGLSHTAAYSERLRGSGASRGGVGRYDRDFGDLSIHPSASWRDADFALAWCQVAAQQTFPYYTKAGYTWFISSRATTTYVHAQEPNGRIPDAINTGAVSGKIGIATARSLHSIGVNVLMGDASVRTTSDRINRAVWRSLGTRNGGELVD